MGRQPLEFDLRRSGVGLAVGAEIEIILLREAKRAGEERRRKALDSGVVFLDRVVEEAPRRRDLVFKVAQLALQLLKIGAGFKVRVRLRERKELAQCSTEHIFSG